MNGTNLVELREVERVERPYACCRDPHNLCCEQVTAQHFIEHCVCGRKHHVMEVDPVPLGVAGAKL